MLHTLSVPVTEPSQVGQARRCAQAVAEAAGLDAEHAGKVALAATEAANNLQLHAKGGELLIRGIDREGAGGVELIAIDRGPGIADFERCLEDGYSTRGTAGQGLGAISRAADELEVHTLPGIGTALWMRLWGGAPPEGASGLVTGLVNVPAPGEDVSGDGWACDIQGTTARLLMVDGLGHGTGAATAAVEAVKAFSDDPSDDPERVLRSIHEGIRHTRGAAAAVAVIDFQARQLRYAAAGNIVSLVLAGGARTNMVSMNGTVGHAIRQLQTFAYPFPPGATLVMHSDGVGPSWNLERYPGLIARHPSLLAAVLYRDFRRVRDDSSVLVVRERDRS